MSVCWAASASVQAAPAIAKTEWTADAAVCELGEQIWLRGSIWNDSLDRALRSIIGCERFTVTAGGDVVPMGKRLSKGELPPGPWIPLVQWIELLIPPRMFVAAQSTAAPLSMVRSDREREANVLVTTVAAWSAYSASAPQVRLRRWMFAVSGDGRALIKGLPLPPLPGLRYAEAEGVATPVGWAWSPPLDVGVLRQCLDLEQGEIALLGADGTCEKLPADAFVAATRSAARLTAESLS